jgi:hypothetical protein
MKMSEESQEFDKQLRDEYREHRERKDAILSFEFIKENVRTLGELRRRVKEVEDYNASK